jgi:plastocyanin
VIGVAAAGVVLAACGSDEPTEASGTIGRGDTVAAVGTDRLRFDPNEFTIPAGREVTLELTAGSVEHDFVVEGPRNTARPRRGPTPCTARSLAIATQAWSRPSRSSTPRDDTDRSGS